MIEAIVAGGIALLVAVAGGAYKLGGDRMRKNGTSTYVTEKFCEMQHRNLDKTLDEIRENTGHIPSIMAWIEIQKKNGSK